MPNQIEDAINEMIQSMYRQKLHCHVNQSVSTNSELLTQIGNGELDSTQLHALTADVQTGGRGQHGRSWQSPKGNVYLSLYYPVCHASVPLVQPISGLLSLCVGYELSQLSIIERLNKRLKYPIGVKWANDIGFYGFNSVSSLSKERLDGGNETFKSQTHIQFNKLAGILIEPVIVQGKTLGIIVGVGLNVANAPKLLSTVQEGMGYQSVCLSELLKQCDGINSEATEVVYQNLYQPIITAILKGILRHQQVSMPNQTQDLSKFLNEYKTVDVLKGHKIKITPDNGVNAINLKDHAQANVMVGETMGIDNHGCLLIKNASDDVHRIFSGKIDVME